MTLIYVVTFFGGHDMWKFKIPILGWHMSEGFEVVCYGKYTKYARIVISLLNIFIYYIVITYKCNIKPVVNLLVIYRCGTHSLKLTFLITDKIDYSLNILVRCSVM